MCIFAYNEKAISDEMFSIATILLLRVPLSDVFEFHTEVKSVTLALSSFP